MSYKRFISYLYHYEMGERVRNVGFARVELSSDLCRITASCTTRVISQKECHVYFIQSKKATVSGIKVQTLPVKEGEINLKIVMEDGFIPGSEVPFSDVTGILFYFTRDNYIGSYWDNSTILYRDIPEIIEKKEVLTKKEKISYVAVKEDEIEVIPEPVVLKMEEEKEPQPEPEFAATEVKPREEERVIVEEKVMMEEKGEELEDEVEAEESETLTEELRIAEDEAKELNEDETVSAMGCQRIDRMRFADHPGAREILSRFVRMYPFDDNEIPECVRLSIRDIGLLPMSAWVLGNNSFLQHGYYTFQHILFGKRMTKDGWSYLIMVPGAMNPKEKELARQFGFHNFKPSRRRCVRNGEFGYWYVPIDFNM